MIAAVSQLKISVAARNIPSPDTLGSGPINLAGMVEADLCGYEEQVRRKAEAFHGLATK